MDDLIFRGLRRHSDVGVPEFNRVGDDLTFGFQLDKSSGVCVGTVM
jgi:hypothetical protein